MAIKDLFQKNKERQRYVTLQSGTQDNLINRDVLPEGVPNVPDGLFTKCGACHEMVLTEDIYFNHYVCPKCGHYARMGARHCRNASVSQPGQRGHAQYRQGL